MHRGYQGSFSLGVPVFLNVDTNVVRPGADLNFFGGFDIGYAVFGLALGAMWTPMNLYNIPGAPAGAGYGRSPMTRLYFAPEVRVQVPNNTPILPYHRHHVRRELVARKRNDIPVCGGVCYFYCARVAVFRFSPGHDGQGGRGLPRYPRGTHIDVGVKYSLSGTGQLQFLRREQWVTPYIGMLFR